MSDITEAIKGFPLRSWLSEHTDLYDNDSDHYRMNCFAGETLVATKRGDVPIRELVGRCELLVPSRFGQGFWKDVTVRNFGRQNLVTLYLHRGRAKKVIRVTNDHRWVLFCRSDRKKIRRPYMDGIVTTGNLRSGDVLSFCHARKLILSDKHVVTPSAIAVAQGFTFGDGSCGVDKSHPCNAPMMTEDKRQSLSPYFSSCRKIKERHTNGYVYDMVVDLPRSWKTLPPHDETFSFLLGWLSGYFSADGYVSTDGSGASLSSATKENLNFVKGICYQLGVRTSPIKSKMRDGFGKISEIHELALRVRDLPDSFWVLSHHREYALKHKNETESNSSNDRWIVDEVVDTNECDEVFCAIVPEEEKFTLADNICTMNCPVCDGNKTLSIAKNGGYFRCFRCDDGGHGGNVWRGRGDLILLISLVENISKREAIRKVFNLSGHPDSFRYEKKAVSIPSSIIPENAILVDKAYESHQAKTALAARGLSHLSSRIYFCIDGVYSSRWILPATYLGELVGIEAKSFTGAKPKSLFPNWFKKSNYLYTTKWNTKQDFAVITESIFDAETIAVNGVGIYGSALSQAQLNRLFELREQLGVHRLIWFLDQDAAFKQARTIQSKSGLFENYFVKVPKGEDPNSLGYDECWKLISSASPVNNMSDIVQNIVQNRLDRISAML